MGEDEDVAYMEETSRSFDGSKDMSHGEDPNGNDPSNENEAGSERTKQNHRKKRRKGNKLLQDCISVEIPLNFTADLGLASRRTRKKRVAELLKAYPAIAQLAASSTDSQGKADGPSESIPGSSKEGNGEMTSEDMLDTGDSSPEEKKTLTNAPERKNFSNMVDYLEAKYAKGVMVDDELAAGERNEDDEKGSVYSETSWIDDSDLKRDVAEQVMAHTTTTKLELTTDDSEFFVNVGTLEVEETEQTKDHYDPLKDVDRHESKKSSRPRKKPGPKPGFKRPADSGKSNPSNSDSGGGKTKAPPSSPASKKDAPSSPPPKKKARLETEKAPPSGGKQPGNNKKDQQSLSPKAERLKKKRREQSKLEAEKKALMERSYAELVAMIKTMNDEELPRRKTKDRVAVTCPADKKPGDSIMFENPHVKGQRLKVKIPKNASPGSIFKVTVPMPKEPSDEGEEGETDHNRWSRELYECLTDYANLYDNWIDTVADRHMANNNKEFSPHVEKRKKFDKLVVEFPKDLKTPIDRIYLQKILRRARQNKHKRDKTAKRLEERAKELSSPQSKDHEYLEQHEETASAGNLRVKGDTSIRRLDPIASSRPVIKLPSFSRRFGKRPFVADDFL